MQGSLAIDGATASPLPKTNTATTNPTALKPRAGPRAGVPMLTAVSVDMKVLIEQMREQVQNIE